MLTSIDPRLGYMIYLSAHPDTLSLVGTSPAGPASLTLNPRWNWIGYPAPLPQKVNDVLSMLVKSNGDILKSQVAFTEYNESAGSWLGNLTYFQPGRGYKLYSAAGAEMEMLKSGSSGNLGLKYEFNMTITASIEWGDLPLSRDLYLQAWIEGQLRGMVPVSYDPSLGKTLAFAMVYGERADVGDKVDLQLWDETLQKSFALTGEEIHFSIDRILGTAGNPVMLAIAGQSTDVRVEDLEAGFSVWPNPFTDRTTIRYTISAESHVSLVVTNPLGQEVARITDQVQSPGEYRYTFDAKGLPTGMYQCTLTTGKSVETLKILLMQRR